MKKKIEIRPIQVSDNPIIKNIIKNTLIELNCAVPGTAFFDESLDNLYAAYQKEHSIYYIALINNRIVGGCGIYPLGQSTTICELQKMYILPEARGLQIGKKLLEKCLTFARTSGYKQCYLESFSVMQNAVKLYLKNAFNIIDKPIGNTGHTACNVHMLLNLQ